MDATATNSKSSKLGWIVAGLLFFGLIVLILPNFIHARNTSAMNACINNLRQLDAAKQQRASGNNVTNSEVAVTCGGLKPCLGQGTKAPFDRFFARTTD